jgi:hypothetical protein
MRLNPKHLTLSELMTGRLFRIPEYQRAYAWEKKQRNELFKDILEAHQTGQEHFMATIVTLANERRMIRADEFNLVEVVDGQQRLTTFIVLMKAIEKGLQSADKIERQIKASIGDLLVKSDDHALILLQTNHDSSNIFSDYIRSGIIQDRPPSTAADKNLLDAVRECEQFVADWSQTKNLVDLVALLRNRFSMIYHELTDESAVYRVFEVLNSRGLDVRWIDKCKSQLMALVFQNAESSQRRDGIKEMHVIWQDIYRTLGLRGDLGDDALRFAGTLKCKGAVNRVLSPEDAAEAIVLSAGSSVRKITDAARWLKTMVDVVESLDSDVRRKAVTRIIHARFLAVAILLRRFPRDVERNLIGHWERVTFRIFELGEADTRNKNGEYVRLACDVLNLKLGERDIVARLRELGRGYSIKEVLGNPSDYIDCYEGWTEQLRYLLFRYDEHLSQRAGEKINEAQWTKIWTHDPSKSIEHISPQASEKPYTHHIGNLTMLPPGVNSSLQDKSPTRKAATYKACGIRATRDVAEVISSSTWNEKAVLARARKLLRFMKKEWAD